MALALFGHEMAAFTVIPLWLAALVVDGRVRTAALHGLLLLAVFAVIYVFFQTVDGAHIDRLMQAIKDTAGYTPRADYYDVFRHRLVGPAPRNYFAATDWYRLATAVALAAVAAAAFAWKGAFTARACWSPAWRRCSWAFSVGTPAASPSCRWRPASSCWSPSATPRRGRSSARRPLLLAFALFGYFIYFDDYQPRPLCLIRSCQPETMRRSSKTPPVKGAGVILRPWTRGTTRREGDADTRVGDASGQSRADPLHRQGRARIPRSSRPIGAAASTSSRACCRPDELSDIERDLHDILERLPVEKGASLDAKGRPALAADCTAPCLHWAQAAQRSVGRHRRRQRPPSGEDVRADSGRRCAQGGRVPDPGLAAVLRGVVARLRPSRPAGRRGGDQRAGLRAVQRGAVDQGAGPRRLGRLAPGRRHALGQPGLGRGQPRLQLHGPALRLHRRQRRVGRAGLAQARQDRHQGAGRQGRHRAAARRRADHLRAGRRRHDQPPGAARLVRQHQQGLARHGELRLPPAEVGAGRHGGWHPQQGRDLRRRPHHASAPG